MYFPSRKGAKMPTTAQGASRRARTTERLRVAVTEQLLQRGYTGVTIEGVAAASGVAKTTIYRRCRFETKPQQV